MAAAIWVVSLFHGQHMPTSGTLDRLGALHPGHIAKLALVRGEHIRTDSALYTRIVEYKFTDQKTGEVVYPGLLSTYGLPRGKSQLDPKEDPVVPDILVRHELVPAGTPVVPCFLRVYTAVACLLTGASVENAFFRYNGGHLL
jgi:hypothetical protein